MKKTSEEPRSPIRRVIPREVDRGCTPFAGDAASLVGVHHIEARRQRRRSVPGVFEFLLRHAAGLSEALADRARLAEFLQQLLLPFTDDDLRGRPWHGRSPHNRETRRDTQFPNTVKGRFYGAALVSVFCGSRTTNRRDF